MTPGWPPRRSETVSLSKPGSDRLKLLAAVVIPLALAAVLVVSSGGLEAGRPAAVISTPTMLPAEAKAWQTRVDDAFKPLAEDLQSVVSEAADWTAGKNPTDTFSADLERHWSRLAAARDQIAALPPFKPARVAHKDYVACANLYLEMARVYRSAVEPGAEPLKVQLDLLARRLRTLADRIYDRGRVAVDPSAADLGPAPGVEVQLPSEVPDWAAEGLAAGPPLETGPPPPGTFPTRQQRRAEEPTSAWIERVRALGVPRASELAGAIEAGDATELGALARRFSEVTAALRRAPDPAGGRQRGARAGLDLLVYGEA